MLVAISIVMVVVIFFFFNDTATTEIYTLSLHDALPISNVKQSGEWKNIDASHALRTRDIIRYWNNHFDENISDSSYDDIRRKDLKLPVLARIINSSSANPNRSEEHTSELQSRPHISYAVFCLKKKKKKK